MSIELFKRAPLSGVPQSLGVEASAFAMAIRKEERGN
jgi:hypothetical protein